MDNILVLVFWAEPITKKTEGKKQTTTWGNRTTFIFLVFSKIVENGLAVFRTNRAGDLPLVKMTKGQE